MSADHPPAVICLDNVVKTFRPATTALRGISGEIPSGKITGIIGPDGAGKSTLMRIFAGLMVPESGTVRVLGFDAHRQAAGIQSEIGYMPQRFGLYEDLTVQENLNLYADLRGLERTECPEVFEQLLSFTDLKGMTSRLAGKLSGGMKQKLGLACALLKKPRLLLLDEPSVGVDPLSRRELWSMVNNLTAEGISIVWSTAYLDEAESCDHVLLLNEGSLMFDGPPEELTRTVAGRAWTLTGFSKPKRELLVPLIARNDIIDGLVQGDAIRLVTSSDFDDSEGVRLLGGARTRLRQVPPRFEDGFVNLLGGRVQGESPLARATVPRPASDDRPVIEARGLTKRFGDFTAVRDITFKIPRGQVFGLLGPNGAGKSTTFKLLCGLLKPTAGEGRVAGFDLRHDSAAVRNRLGYMAQKFSLYGDLTIGQNLRFFAGVYGLWGSAKRRRIELMNDIFQFQPYARMASKQLPLGMKQRLALACAVLHEPEALFLDEPTSGVDPIMRRDFWSHINGLVTKGVTVLVTTHFMEEAEYCDRIALIHRGESIATGTPDELKTRVATPDRPNPTMEDAFIATIESMEKSHA